MFTLAGDTSSKDRITPHRLSLLILIKSYADIYDGKNAEYPRMIWLDDWSSKRHLDRVLLSWIQQPDGSFKDIVRTVGMCSKVLCSAFIEMITAICNYGSFEGLENFISNLGFNIFEEKVTILHKRGLLGQFGRRMLVYYERLAFCEIQPLFESFVKYCAPHVPLKQVKEGDKDDDHSDASNTEDKNTVTMDDMELESQSEMDSKSSRESVDADLKSSDLKHEDKPDDFDSCEYFTQRQAEYFFSQQVALLGIKESDAVPPSALQHKIRQLLINNPELTQAHYVSYLNNLRIKELCGSVDSMFMYFIRHNVASSPSDSKAAEEENMNRTCRFAALNLALLHQRFGHKRAAVAAVKESISLAQLANDNVCLRHALALLNHLEKKTKKGKSADDVIKPVKKRKLTDLAFNAIQTHMKEQAQHGETPSQVFLTLAAADAMQCTRPCNYVISSSYAHRSSLWRMYGKRHMALLYSQMTLSTQATIDRKSSRVFIAHYCPEDVALALSHLVDMLDEDGYSAASLSLLGHAKLRFPLNSSHSKFWRKSEALMHHRTALRLLKYQDAQQAEQVIEACDHQEALLCKARSFLSRHENIRAHCALSELLNAKPLEGEEESSELSPELRCKALILMGGILAGSKATLASSLRYLLDALSVACKHYFHASAVETLMKIAQLQIHFNSPSLARSCLRSASFECMSNSSLHLRSRFFLIFSRCLLESEAEPSQNLDECVALLKRAQVGFETTQDTERQRDVIHMLAMLYNEKAVRVDSYESESLLKQRDESAAEFRRLDTQLGCLKYSLLI